MALNFSSFFWLSKLPVISPGSNSFNSGKSTSDKIGWLSGFFGTLAREALELYRLPYAKAVAASKNFDPLQRMTEVAKEKTATL
jgi:hypothetical protein